MNLNAYPKSGLLRQTGQMILQGLQELTDCLLRRYAEFASAVEAGARIPANLITKILCELSADQIGSLFTRGFQRKTDLGPKFPGRLRGGGTLAVNELERKYLRGHYPQYFGTCGVPG